MFLYIYIQPMWRLTLFALGAFIVYSIFIFLLQKHHRAAAAKKITTLLWGIWICGLLLVTLRRGGGVREVDLIPFRGIYLGFTENVEMFRTMFMNVLLFVPGGYLGAAMLDEMRRDGWLFLGLILVSAAIEAVQYGLCLGKTEMDDLICNGFGALLGIFFWNGAKGCWTLWKSKMKYRF